MRNALHCKWQSFFLLRLYLITIHASATITLKGIQSLPMRRIQFTPWPVLCRRSGGGTRNIFVSIQSLLSGISSGKEEEKATMAVSLIAGSERGRKKAFGRFIKIRVTCRTWTAISTLKTEWRFSREDDYVDNVHQCVPLFEAHISISAFSFIPLVLPRLLYSCCTNCTDFTVKWREKRFISGRSLITINIFFVNELVLGRDIRRTVKVKLFLAEFYFLSIGWHFF